MKTVLICDFCSHTETLDSKGSMTEHEKGCAFNPINKYCYSCKHKLHFQCGTEDCAKSMDFCEAEDEGNCAGHEVKDNLNEKS